MAASRVLFVPRAVLLKSSKLREMGGIVEIAADAIKPLAVQPRKTSFWETVEAEAEKLGHICADYEMNSDSDSPSEWCPACRHLANARSRDAWGKALLSGVSPNALVLKPAPAGYDFQKSEQLRFRRWVSTLKPFDLSTLRAGGVGAKLLIKTEFLGVQMSWCDKMIAFDPDFLTRRMPEVRRPVFVAPPPQRAAPRVSLPPPPPAVPVQEFVSMDQRPAAVKEAEFANWLAITQGRPIWTSQGAQPYRHVAEANRSSMLVTGFGPEVSLADIREIASAFAPVRDVFRPPRAQHMVFVTYVGAGAASAARTHFRANPLSLNGRPLVFDVSNRN